MIKVIYNEKQVANSGNKISPSSDKPRHLAQLLQADKEVSQYIEFEEPWPINVADIKRCHDSDFVDDVIKLKRPNGFGTIKQSVVESLFYTNGAMYTAAWTAIKEKVPTAALVSGFHHAGYSGFEEFGYFCTFNGLMITATKLVEEDVCKKILIVDCDQHYGNGTDDILSIVDPKQEKYMNLTFGKFFQVPSQAQEYLDYFDVVKQKIAEFKPDVILYQSGADVHINDPFGGVLTEEQMYERDVKMFTIAKDLNIPIAWDLAGGYQIDENGGCNYVLQLHLNTFKACKEVYGL